ncbi:MAG: hypothetical protein ABI566_00210 [Pseudolysinimonas sp.]
MRTDARFRPSFAVVAAIAAALVLAGCSGSGAEGPDEPVAESPAEPAVDTGCVVGEWTLDLTDLASQMAIELTANGLEVTEYTGAGHYLFTILDTGVASMDVNSTFSLTATSGAGPEITVVQTHTGAPFGFWGWVGDTNVLEFDDWNDGGYLVENLTSIGGVNTTDGQIPIALPSDPLGESNMTVTCDGSTMTTQSAGSPYLHHWSSAS